MIDTNKLLLSPEEEKEEIAWKVKQAKWNAKRNNVILKDGKVAIYLEDVPSDVVIPNEVTNPSLEPVCICCKRPFDWITSVYGRICVSIIAMIIHSLEHVVINKELVIIPTTKTIKYPELVTGRACKSCFDILYESKYYDSKGDMKRGIEILFNEPKLNAKTDLNARRDPDEDQVFSSNRSKWKPLGKSGVARKVGL